MVYAGPGAPSAKMRKDFIYTQTRLQARHGMRPDDHTWALVESQKDLAGYLQSARQSRLAPWVMGLQSNDASHLLESVLLKHFRNYIMEVMVWVPSSWRRSVGWIVCLSYLPILQHLLSNNTAYSWMLEDPRIKLATGSDLEQRIAHISQSEFSPLLKYWNPDVHILDAWMRHWSTLCPQQKRKSSASFDSFLNLLTTHRDVFQQLSVDRTWQQRKLLARKATVMFRNYAYQPVNVFVHLLLVALDVERLRGGIIQRRLFDDDQVGNMQEKSS